MALKEINLNREPYTGEQLTYIELRLLMTRIPSCYRHQSEAVAEA